MDHLYLEVVGKERERENEKEWEPCILSWSLQHRDELFIEYVQERGLHSVLDSASSGGVLYRGCRRDKEPAFF